MSKQENIENLIRFYLKVSDYKNMPTEVLIENLCRFIEWNKMKRAD